MLHENGVLSSDESETFLEFGRKYKESKEHHHSTQKSIEKDIEDKLGRKKRRRNDLISMAEKEYLSSAEKQLEAEIVQNWEANLKREDEELKAKRIGSEEWKERVKELGRKKKEKLKRLRPQIEMRRRKREEEIERANEEFLKEKAELLRSTGADVLLQKSDEKYVEETKDLNAKFAVMIADCKKKLVTDYIIPEHVLAKFKKAQKQ